MTILTRCTAKRSRYSGTWSSWVRVWFRHQLTVPASETTLPMLPCVGAGSRGPLPSSPSGVNVSRQGVLFIALKRRSKGKVTSHARGGTRGRIR